MKMERCTVMQRGKFSILGDWVGWASITRHPTLGELPLTHLLSHRQRVTCFVTTSQSWFRLLNYPAVMVLKGSLFWLYSELIKQF